MSKSDMNFEIPDWVPENAGEEFAVKFVKGTKKKSEPIKQNSYSTNKKLNIEDYIKGVRENNRTILAKTITLIESNTKENIAKAEEVLNKLLPYTGNSLRIGISGVPGAGKSTLIEALGLYLIKLGKKVAVLTIDPSSTITKGSILGDKTRMEKLCREENCFIRPSPSGGTLGGVARKSRETILICEAAGYDVILIETVGVGQSEITVRSMVDFYLLVQIPGAGDELQGIKKGVIEIADMIVINKADGDNLSKANTAAAELTSVLRYLNPYTKSWQPRVQLCSALANIGIKDIWEAILEFEKITKANNHFYEERKKQNHIWIENLIQEYLIQSFYNNKMLAAELKNLKRKVDNNELLPTLAAEILIEKYINLFKEGL